MPKKSILYTYLLSEFLQLCISCKVAKLYGAKLYGAVVPFRYFNIHEKTFFFFLLFYYRFKIQRHTLEAWKNNMKTF